MSYTTPTVTASGATFAQLQAAGLSGVTDRLIAANTFTALELAMVNSVRHGRFQDVLDAFRQRTDNFISGAPIDAVILKAEMKSLARVLVAFTEILNEVNVLVDANPGTLTTVKTQIGNPRPVRTFP